MMPSNRDRFNEIGSWQDAKRTQSSCQRGSITQPHSHRRVIQLVLESEARRLKTRKHTTTKKCVHLIGICFEQHHDSGKRTLSTSILHNRRRVARLLPSEVRPEIEQTNPRLPNWQSTKEKTDADTQQTNPPPTGCMCKSSKRTQSSRFLHFHGAPTPDRSHTMLGKWTKD
jgi:hypothetical protein